MLQNWLNFSLWDDLSVKCLEVSLLGKDSTLVIWELKISFSKFVILTKTIQSLIIQKIYNFKLKYSNLNFFGKRKHVKIDKHLSMSSKLIKFDTKIQTTNLVVSLAEKKVYRKSVDSKSLSFRDQFLFEFFMYLFCFVFNWNERKLEFWNLKVGKLQTTPAKSSRLIEVWSGRTWIKFTLLKYDVIHWYYLSPEHVRYPMRTVKGKFNICRMFYWQGKTGT